MLTICMPINIDQYLFRENNVPEYSRDKIPLMNRELTTRLNIVSQSMRACGLDDDEDLYENISQVIYKEIFRRYC